MPLPTPETIRLSDGRILEFACYGDPAGLPAVFFHGFLGSHYQASFAHEAARRHGLLLVAPSRPGIGRSTPCRRQTVAETAHDVVQLANHLGLERFAAIGISGGAPYALACLARLPGRVPLGALVSGLGPVEEPGVLRQMNPVSRQALRLARSVPWLVQGLLALRTRGFHGDPEGFLDGLVRRWPRADQELFRRPEVRAVFLADLREVLVAGDGCTTLVRELQLFSRWGFDLAEVPASARVLLWHGEEDGLVPPFMTRLLAQRLPWTETAFRPGGHLLVVEHIEELIQRGRAALAEHAELSSR